tara:strand:+ start:1185 stop:1490 length:306 start_codon:yes stop_codon:yes gene_type:complete
MFRTTENQEKFYRVSFSNHETIVLASSHDEAAAQGLSATLKKFKKETNISLAVVVDRIDDDSLSTEVFEISKILDNIGYFSLSKKISYIRDFLLDKSRRSS